MSDTPDARGRRPAPEALLTEFYSCLDRTCDNIEASTRIPSYTRRAIEIAQQVPRKVIIDYVKDLPRYWRFHLAEKVRDPDTLLYQCIADVDPAARAWARFVRMHPRYFCRWKNTMSNEPYETPEALADAVLEMYQKDRAASMGNFFFHAVLPETTEHKETLSELLDLWYTDKLRGVPYDWERYLKVLTGKHLFDAQSLVDRWGLRWNRFLQLVRWVDAKTNYSPMEQDPLIRFAPATATPGDLLRVPSRFDWALREEVSMRNMFLPLQEAMSLEYDTAEWIQARDALLRRCDDPVHVEGLISAHIARLDNPWYTIGVYLLLDTMYPNIRQFLEKRREGDYKEFLNFWETTLNNILPKLREGELNRLKQERTIIPKLAGLGPFKENHVWVTTMLAVAFQLEDRNTAARLVSEILGNYGKQGVGSEDPHFSLTYSLVLARYQFRGHKDRAFQLLNAYIDDPSECSRFSGNSETERNQGPADDAYNSDEDAPAALGGRMQRFLHIRDDIMQSELE